MKLPFFLIFTLFYFAGHTQKNDRLLQQKLENTIKGFHGNVYLYVKNLKTGGVAAINADTVCPTASMVKVPILIGVMDKINNGELLIHQQIIYSDSLLYPGVDILGSFKNGEKIELSKLIMLMMSMSDNTASRYLQMLAGTGERINSIMDSLGFRYTRMNSKTPGREEDYDKYGWGQTTPREMANLFEKIYKGQVLSPAISNRMLRFMNRNYWDADGLSQIPPNAAVFSKNGALEKYRSETALIRGFDSEYVVCIITNNNTDTSWTYNNEACTLIRKVSKVLWNYFEPMHQWELPVDSQKFY